MRSAPHIVAGLYYTQSSDNIFYPEDAQVSRSFFTKRYWHHIVVADIPIQYAIIDTFARDMVTIPRLPEWIPQVRSVLWREYAWIIVSLSPVETNYLHTIALDAEHTLATRLHHLPDNNGTIEPFPFTGPNFRTLVEQKYQR